MVKNNKDQNSLPLIIILIAIFAFIIVFINRKVIVKNESIGNKETPTEYSDKTEKSSEKDENVEKLPEWSTEGKG